MAFELRENNFDEVVVQERERKTVQPFNYVLLALMPIGGYECVQF